MGKFRLVITGNPGVGKHTTAKIISAKLDADVIDINQVALENSAIAGNTDHGLDVDVRKLRAIIAKSLLAGKKKDMVIVGHLAPYIVSKPAVTMVVVLRRSPYELEKTLSNRGYSYAKVKENVSSEILGVSMYDAIKTFGRAKVAEFDTTARTPEKSASEIVGTLKRKLPKKTGQIDWLTLISEKDDIRRFFEY